LVQFYVYLIHLKLVLGGNPKLISNYFSFRFRLDCENQMLGRHGDSRTICQDTVLAKINRLKSGLIFES